MPLPLPNLDDRTYADLVAEARSQIPVEFPTWTDHNPSDTGIILLELLAWVTETVLYRVNQIPDANILAFLRLLNGPEWSFQGNLQAAIQQTILDRRQRYRAVTLSDYEHLVLQVWPQHQPGHPPLARVHGIPKHKPTDDGALEYTPGHLTLVVVPNDPDSVAPRPNAALLQNLLEWLESRRLLTTHHHIIGPRYVAIKPTADLFLTEGAEPNQVLVAALKQLQEFFHPFPSVPRPHWQGTGWPFGQAVYPSEIYQLLDQVPGVDYVENLRLSRAADSPSLSDQASQTNNGSPAEQPPRPIEIQPHELAQVVITQDNYGDFFTLKEYRGNSWQTVPITPTSLHIQTFLNTLSHPSSPSPLSLPAPPQQASPLSLIPPPLHPSTPPPSSPPPYTSYLPATLQASSFLDQFLSALEQILSGRTTPPPTAPCPGIVHSQVTNPPALETIISLTHTYLDLDENHGTPDEFLPWLASWVALTLQDNWPTRTKRQFIREIASLYRQRGTKASLQKILQIYLASAGFEAVSQKAQITEFPNYPYFFQVTLNLPVPDPELYQSQARIARTIIDQEKPAHTYYALQILLPTMQVSGQVFPLKLSEPGTITATLNNVQVSGENPPSPLLSLKIKNGAPQPELCAQSIISGNSSGTTEYEVSEEEFNQDDIWFVSVANLSSASIDATLDFQFPGGETGQDYSLSLSPGLKMGRPPDGNTVLGNESTPPTEV